MASFPRTYGIVRDGRPTTVAVSDPDSLLALRTELELIQQFGADASPGFREALQSRLEQLDTEADTAARSVVADMCTILADATAPANGLAIACIDADFPQIRKALNMASIRKERNKFRKDVASEVHESGQENVDELAAAFAEATAEMSGSQTGAEESPEDLLTDADQLLAELGDADKESGPPTVEPTGEAAVGLAGSEQELAEIAEGFEDAANQLDELTESLGREVGKPESLMEPTDVGWDQTQEEAETDLTGLDLSADNTAFSDPASDFDKLASEAAAAAADEPEDAAMTSWLDGEENRPDAAGTDSIDEAQVPGGEPPIDLADLVSQVTDTQPWCTEEADSELASLEMGEIPCSPETVAAEGHSESPTASVPVESEAAAPAGCAESEFRRQLTEIRTTLTAQMDRLGELMTAAEQLHHRARHTLQQAEQLRTAAKQAHTASCQYTAIQSEADRARATYEQAQQKAAQARQAWESAQRAADHAAGLIDHST
ncbi:MAG: hypothetical protein GXY55_21130 [Phycisphaerae bacterium]|nr:hypothetical protein [Phycisphaerae bacterium]